MVNLRGIANSATSAINPNVRATVLRSAGSTTLPNGARVPKYKTSQAIVQVQALSFSDLTQADGLNIQGVRRAVYVNGAVAGLIRIKQKGGDVLVFDQGTLIEGTTWLCVHVLEQWPQWCKFIITLQDEINLKDCACS